MTREIKFRGKCCITGKFVYGDLIHGVGAGNGNLYILLDKINLAYVKNCDPLDGVRVDPATVGQFTGLKDKSGKEIYEGDILRVPPKDNWDEANYASFEVFFHDGDMNADYNIGFSMNRTHYKGSICGAFVPPFKPTATKKMEIIGNIHDNPELLNQ